MAASTEPAIRLLDDFQLKALLQDVESLNASRDAIILKDVCKMHVFTDQKQNVRLAGIYHFQITVNQHRRY